MFSRNIAVFIKKKGFYCKYSNILCFYSYHRLDIKFYTRPHLTVGSGPLNENV